MRKISNREEANDYYKLVNKGVDEFISKTNAKPTEVHKYLTNNKKRFLRQLDLDDVDGIENILKDVVSHRKHLQDDKIITFENFSSLNEGFLELSKPSIDFEKVLADKFNSSLGHIDIVDPQYHLYKVNDFGKSVFCIVLSESDLAIIRKYLVNELKKDVSSKIISIDKVNGVEAPPLKFWVSDFINGDLLVQLLNTKVSDTFLLDYFVSMFRSVFSDFDDSDFSVSVSMGHYLVVFNP